MKIKDLHTSVLKFLLYVLDEEKQINMDELDNLSDDMVISRRSHVTDCFILIHHRSDWKDTVMIGNLPATLNQKNEEPRGTFWLWEPSQGNIIGYEQRENGCTVTVDHGVVWLLTQIIGGFGVPMSEELERNLARVSAAEDEEDWDFVLDFKDVIDEFVEEATKARRSWS